MEKIAEEVSKKNLERLKEELRIQEFNKKLLELDLSEGIEVRALMARREQEKILKTINDLMKENKFSIESIEKQLGK